jgi:phage tail sheath protein FI
VASGLRHPGVYIEETPSGARTITGVATSITAFIGRASRGPVNQAVTINSFASYQRIFGGLWVSSTLGYSVQDFFANGGIQAIVVRLYHGDPGNLSADPAVSAPATAAVLTVGALQFSAASPGKWGNNLRVVVDQNNASAGAAASLGVAVGDLFSLTVRDTGSGAVEQYINLTVKDTSRRVDRILSLNSNLIVYSGNGGVPDSTTVIAAGSDHLSQLEGTLSTKTTALTAAQIANPVGDVTAQQTAVKAAEDALTAALTSADMAISDGLPLSAADFLPNNGMAAKQGLYALEQADLFNLLVIPPYWAITDALDTDTVVVAAAATYCESRRAMLIVDAPKDWWTKDVAKTKFSDANTDFVGTRSRNAALFFPRLLQANPLHNNQLDTFAASGAVAGIFARTDAQRGVWKAPAGLQATFNGISGVSVPLTDADNGELNPLGINCLRSFPAHGQVVWGARTLRGADQLADDYKYTSVRRTALFIEESLHRGLKWVVFEPNNEPLWAQIRLNAGTFMQTLFREGAFQGSSPREAYFVKCDNETTTQVDIDLGIVNVLVGFAPLKPTEFVVIQLQQIAGQSTI